MDCIPPGSSVHGILQARILEWVAIPFSRRSSQPKDGTQASRIAGKFFKVERAAEEVRVVRYENSTLLLLTLKMGGRQHHPRNARGLLEVGTGNEFSSKSF